MFVALALDDIFFGDQEFGLVESWRKAGRPVELHAYERGEHAFGTGVAGTTTVMLLDQLRAWMEMPK
jgi:acetyl esterase/lipase